jgi:histo-blood group ABO system transferase
MPQLQHYIRGLQLLLICIVFSLNGEQLHIGLCVVATGKYIAFVKPLLDSAEQFFCPRHKKTYFIFTDGTESDLDSLLSSPYKDNVVITHQKRLGWPHDTLMRFSIYNEHSNLFASTDYMFAVDADMLFVGIEGDEILSDRVATQHPGFEKNKPLWGNGSPYDRNSNSTAYVAHGSGTHYFAGGFYGGTTPEFNQLVATITHNIFTDLTIHNYIAVWHDESHLNRYFIDNAPSIILDRSYCYPENGQQKDYPICSPKLLALDKDHSAMRE